MTSMSPPVEAAAEAVKIVGIRLSTFYGKAMPIRQKSVGASDSVTSFDIEAELFLREKLGAYDSSIGFRGEELPPTGRDDLYWLIDPIDGTEYFIRGVPIHVSDRPPSRAYLSVNTTSATDRSAKTFLEIRRRYTVQNLICCGYEFCLIAQGKTEGLISFDPYGNDYDFAAGTLLIAEAGGHVTNVGSSGYDLHNYDYIAANVPVYEELSRLDSPLAAYM